MFEGSNTLDTSRRPSGEVLQRCQLELFLFWRKALKKRRKAFLIFVWRRDDETVAPLLLFILSVWNPRSSSSLDFFLIQRPWILHRTFHRILLRNYILNGAWMKTRFVTCSPKEFPVIKNFPSSAFNQTSDENPWFSFLYLCVIRVPGKEIKSDEYGRE